MVDFINGQGFLWDGFWHCHFALNFSPKRRVVLVLLIEKTHEFAALEPFRTLNHLLSTHVMPKIAFWASASESYRRQ